MNSPMIISAAVDDAGLSVVDFRILSHICRRAGGGECWAGVSSIATSCRVNPKTARSSIRSLVDLGWVKIQKRTGQTSVLIPCFPSGKAEETPTNPIPYPIQYPTQMDTGDPYQLDTPHPSQMDTPKGDPIRIPKKETKRDVLALPFSSNEFLESWTLWLDHRKALKKPSTPQSQKLALGKLAKMTERQAIDAIQYSVEKNWQSIYPPKPTASTIRPTTEQFTFQKNGHNARPFD